MTSLSRSISMDRIKDEGIGITGMIICGGGAYGSYLGVLYLGGVVETAARSFWETPNTLPTATPNRALLAAPADVISTETIIHIIQACTTSGSNAAMSVGFVETLYQYNRYRQSDQTKSWGVNMIEGGYRGAAVGALTAFSTSQETLPQKIASAAVGAIFGCAIGNGVACISHILRSMYVPNQG